jgi:hypothetical protein
MLSLDGPVAAPQERAPSQPGAPSLQLVEVVPPDGSGPLALVGTEPRRSHADQLAWLQ